MTWLLDARAGAGGRSRDARRLPVCWGADGETRGQELTCTAEQRQEQRREGEGRERKERVARERS